MSYIQDARHIRVNCISNKLRSKFSRCFFAMKKVLFKSHFTVQEFMTVIFGITTKNLK